MENTHTHTILINCICWQKSFPNLPGRVGPLPEQRNPLFPDRMILLLHFTPKYWIIWKQQQLRLNLYSAENYPLVQWFSKLSGHIIHLSSLLKMHFHRTTPPGCNSLDLGLGPIIHAINKPYHNHYHQKFN